MVRKQNNKLKLIAATSMSIFSLAAVFVASFAWFTAARNADAGGSGFEVIAYDGLVENISLYKQSQYTSSTDGTYTYTYGNKIVDIDVDSSGKMTYTEPSDKEKLMDAYDGYFYDEPVSVLALIKINTGVAKAHTNGISLTPVSNKTEQQLEESTKLDLEGNSLSDILQFSYVNISESEKTSFSNGAFIQSGDTRYLESFMTLSNGSSQTTASYKSVLTGNTYGYDSYKNQSGESFYIGCVFEYNTENIEHIYSINIANDTINDVSIGGSLKYTQDFYLRID